MYHNYTRCKEILKPWLKRFVSYEKRTKWRDRLLLLIVKNKFNTVVMLYV